MIPLSTFNLLVAVDVLFVVYSIIDHKNRLYANIAIAFMAGLLSAFLSSVISNDVVYDIVGSAKVEVYSPSVGYFLLFVSSIMFLYTIFMVYEVIDEQLEEKKAIAKQKEENGADEE